MRARQHGSQQPSAIGRHSVKEDLSVSHVQRRHCPNPALPALSGAKKIVTLVRRGVTRLGTGNGVAASCCLAGAGSTRQS